jgi:hypothetical protein
MQQEIACPKLTNKATSRLALNDFEDQQLQKKTSLVDAPSKEEDGGT